MVNAGRKLLKWTAVALGALVVLIGVLLLAFRIAMTQTPQYRERLQAWLNERTGLIIEFRDISARWRWYGPELVFDDSVLRTQDRSAVLATARRGSVGLDVWGLFTTGRLNAGRIELDAPQLSLVRTVDGHLQLVGQGPLKEREQFHPYELDRMPTGRFLVRNAEVSFRDQVTGRGPFQFTGVAFELRRRAREVDLTGEAQLPKMLGKRLKFAGNTRGGFDDPTALVSSFSVEGSALDLAGLDDLLPTSWPVPQSGTGDLALSGSFTGARLDRIAAKINFTQVNFELPQWAIPLPGPAPLVMREDVDGDGKPDEPPPPDPAAAALNAIPAPTAVLYERMIAKISAERTGDTLGNAWKITAEDLSVERKGMPWAPATLKAEWSQSAPGALSLHATVDHFNLQNVWPLLAFTPQSENAARLRALDAQGVLNQLEFSFERAAAEQAPQYSLRAGIAGLGFAPVARTPGLRGVNGRLELTEAGGKFALASQQLQFSLPRLFRDTLAVQAADVGIAWTRDATALRVSVDNFRIATADGNASGKMQLDIPADGSSPTIVMNAVATELNAAAATHYMPAGVMSSKTLEWLDRAFVAGRVTRADLDLHGPLRRFPFRDGSGLFLIQAHIDGLGVNYQPGWTPASDAVIDVEFRNEGMTAHTQSANVGGLQVNDIVADFPDFRTAALKLRGGVNGDLSDALQYLQWSPIGPRLGEVFLGLKGNGPLKAHVDLLLPLKKVADRRIRVDAQVTDATLNAAATDAAITHLNGTLGIRQSLIATAQLQGRIFKGPFELTVRPDRARRNETAAATWTGVGHADAAELARVLHLPSSIPVSGSTDWRASTRFAARADGEANDAPHPQEILFDATLQGFGIGLPEPLRKMPEDSRPLHMDIEFDGERSWLARAAFGPVRALVNIAKSSGGWGLDRGTIRADGMMASLPDRPGLRIEGELPSLDLDAWFAIKSNPGGTVKASDVLRAANVHVGTLQILGHEWRDVRGVLQATDKGWRVDVAGPQAAGQLVIPYDFTGSQPLVARLDKLALVSSAPPANGQTPAAEQDPRMLPSIEASIGDFLLDQHDVGNVELKLARVPDGVQLQSLSIHGASFTTDAHGSSLVTNGKTNSSLEFTVSSTDVGDTLRALNYGDFMTAKHGDARAHLTWPGGFDAQFMARASGTITVNLEAGQLLTVQPGAGRVVGLLSVAALPRRLSLDFSDLFDKGLGFDTVHGDFELRNGNAYTNNLLLSGPAAEIGIAGRTGLGTRDYDQTAVVTGKIGSTLPVAGAVIGGPAVGAALLLFTQIFKEPLKGVKRGYYRITGPWDNPSVERVQAGETKDAAASVESSP